MDQNLTVIMYHYVRDLPNTNYPEIKGLLINDFKGILLITPLFVDQIADAIG